jgi:hypothetical protein
MSKHINEVWLLFIDNLYLPDNPRLSMDPIIILVAIAVALLVYQLFFRNDDDKLDNNGNPIKKK